MKIISVRENQTYVDAAITYIQSKWASEKSMLVYDDCIRSSLTAKSNLPQWYLVIKESKIIACAGLIVNDFISRMDLYPWLCSLYVEEDERHCGVGKALIEYAISDSRKYGFKHLFLCTDHIGYYEQYGFSYIGDGYHPWGESSRIYKFDL